ncbi:MAG: permease [Deltaproteobacteria bacterium]|nr:permease [Deltaproteobacteria bacterium]
MNIFMDILKNTWILGYQMALWLLGGFFIAALLHVLIPFSYIRKHLGSSNVGGVLKAGVIGIPLPLCSCSVLPVATSLRRAGASKPSVLTFLVTTPVTGVDSIAATWAFMGWFFTLGRLIVSIIIGLVAGLISIFSEVEDSTEENSEISSNKPESSSGRLKEIINYTFIELPSTIASSILLGLLIGGLITTLIPPGFIHEHIGTGIWGILISVIIAIPVYVCATGSIPIAAAMAVSGFSPGATLAFLIAGPATNAVAITTIRKLLGNKNLIIYLSVIFMGSTLSAIAFDKIIELFNIDISLHVKNHSHSGANFTDYASGVVLFGLLFYHAVTGSEFYQKLFQKTVTKESEQQMPSHILNIPDMTCNHCKMNVTNILSQIPGVSSVEIDIPSHTAKFNCENDFELNLAIRNLKDGGYTPLDNPQTPPKN